MVQSVGPRLVDPGSPFGRGVELTSDGRAELTPQSPSPLTGYCILNADSLEEAESLVRDMLVTLPGPPGRRNRRRRTGGLPR